MAFELLRIFGEPFGVETINPVAIPASWIAAVACALVAGTVGWLRPVSWASIANLVDLHYGMKDRASSALDFASRDKVDPLMKLQIEDAKQGLQRIEPTALLPFRDSAMMSTAVVGCGLLFALTFVQPTQSQPLIDSEANELVQQVANDQAQTLDETIVEALRELAKESDEPKLDALAAEIERQVEAMKGEKVDQREALANLSQMQQSLAESLNQFGAEKTAAELKQLAAALQSAEALQPAAELLKAEKYQQAAEQLEKIDASSLSKQERDAVAADLKKLRESEKQGKQSEVMESAELMQQGLEKNDAAQFKDGQSKAASAAKKQGAQQSIANNLRTQLNRLSESKSQFQAQAAGGAVQKSTRDSNKVGQAASNKPFGDEATKLDSTRREESLTGVQGEGSSERETTQSSEGQQDASVSYRNRYTEFRKQMEEVIDSEPLPLSHRQTVRKYFESIRPTNGDETE